MRSEAATPLAARSAGATAAPATMPGVSRTHKLIIGALFGLTFAVSSILRDAVAPGIVGGVLAGVVVYLVLTRVHEHNEAVRRRRERDRADTAG